MIKISLSLILVLTFLSLSILHFYWAFGGIWGFSEGLPTNESGLRILNPSALDCVIVGTALLGFVFYYLVRSGMMNNVLPGILSNILDWIIPMIFIIRAIGDFKYIGFFKRVNQTSFGQADSFYFSPLCLMIGIIGLVLIKMK